MSATATSGKRAARTTRLRAYVQAVTLLGIFVLFTVAFPPQFSGSRMFILYAVAVLLSSPLKIRLPGLASSLSPNIIPILIGIAECTPTESVLMAIAGTVTQYLWHSKKVRPQQLAFNLAVTAITAASSGTMLRAIHHWQGVGEAGAFAALAVTYFTMNSLPICTAMALSEHKRLTQVWTDVYASSFPAFMLSAVAAGIYFTGGPSRWVLSASMIPFLYLVYKAYWIFLSRLQAEKATVADSAALNLRTMEALVAAIEAKDGANYEDLSRTRVCAMQIGKQLELADDEMRALAAAALLRDIGKMAVPDHLLARPDQLTAAEMERIQSHVAIGAAILRPVHFPFPVLPIIRAHHERWDGKGYPNGLEGEQIPLGARILSVVDTLVSLTSNRSYRPATTLEGAIEAIEAESNRAFDPRVVAALRECCRGEGAAQFIAAQSASASAENSGESVVPTLGAIEWDANALDDSQGSGNALYSILRARYEDDILAPPNTVLTLKESLAVFAMRLSRVVPYETLVVFTQIGERLVPEYVTGDEARLFGSREMEVGSGVSGWVARSGKSLQNAPPSDELAALGLGAQSSKMQAAISVPLESVTGRRGVLTMYRTRKNAFTNDDLRVLLAIRLKVLNWELHGLASDAVLALAGSLDSDQRESNAASLFKAVS